MICRRDYAERVVASFPNQIKSYYYGGNISVYIEVIALKHLNTLPQTEINSSTKSCPRHSVFHYFLYNDIKQDDAIVTAHSKRLIELLKEQKVMTSTLITIWENIDLCA